MNSKNNPKTNNVDITIVMEEMLTVVFLLRFFKASFKKILRY